MPRHPSTETFHLDLRSSPSQQHLNPPSRSPSLRSHDDDLDELELDNNNHRNSHHHHHHNMEPASSSPGPQDSKGHKLDFYSIPVFLLELLVLCALTYAAYFLHFQYEHQPLLSGLYCDDLSYRQHMSEHDWKLAGLDTEQTLVGLLLVVPLVVIIFCELVNSMFGALKFRQIRAICTCCKLHSITRRTFRFAGAYLLGLLIVSISCDILANRSGRLRPYFAEQCPKIYLDYCVPGQSSLSPQPPHSLAMAKAMASDLGVSASSNTSLADSAAVVAPPPAPSSLLLPESSRIKEQAAAAVKPVFERQWVDLSGFNLTQLCNFDLEDEQHRYYDMAMSWPSYPGAILTFACLYISCYLCFVGTARPVRLISCILVMLLLLSATIFNVHLVKIHYNHWDDTAAGAVLGLVVTALVLYVYLNKFRDTHYYETQKLVKPRTLGGGVQQQTSFTSRGFSNEGGYNMDKTTDLSNGVVENGDTTGASNNDLAMRYFQIPRANYRGGAPRPLSSLNQMR